MVKEDLRRAKRKSDCSKRGTRGGERRRGEEGRGDAGRREGEKGGRGEGATWKSRRSPAHYRSAHRALTSSLARLIARWLHRLSRPFSPSLPLLRVSASLLSASLLPRVSPSPRP